MAGLEPVRVATLPRSQKLYRSRLLGAMGVVQEQQAASAYLWHSAECAIYPVATINCVQAGVGLFI
jgi:hypothetical protein